MKKQLLFLSFALFFFLGNQHMDAQEKMEKKNKIEKLSDSMAKANKLTVDMTRHLRLDDAQKEKVYELLVTADQKRAGVNAIENVEQRKEKMAQLEDRVNVKMKEILTEEQYEKYLVVSKKW